MDMILISESKLKVMLTPLDMVEYSLDGESLDCSDSFTRRAFRSILDEAKTMTGFDAANERVFIQVYQSKSGGCELYVTKLTPHKPRIVRNVRGGHVTHSRRLPCYDDSVGAEFTEHFEFSSQSDLLDGCRALDSLGFDFSSAVYSDGERYYLELCHRLKTSDGFTSSDVNYTKKHPHTCFSFLCEYGRQVDSADARLYIDEHCKKICAVDAVRRLSSLR